MRDSVLECAAMCLGHSRCMRRSSVPSEWAVLEDALTMGISFTKGGVAHR